MTGYVPQMTFASLLSNRKNRTPLETNLFCKLWVLFFMLRRSEVETKMKCIKIASFTIQQSVKFAELLSRNEPVQNVYRKIYNIYRQYIYTSGRTIKQVVKWFKHMV